MKTIRLALFTYILLAFLSDPSPARESQVPGVDPRQEVEVPVNRTLRRVDPDRVLEPPDPGPYDPVRNLKSAVQITRAEAASYIGWARRYDCEGALVSFLSRENGTGPDIVSALWALGQVGSQRSVPVLLEWADRGAIECRVEALRSLREIRDPAALPAFIEGLTRPVDPDDDPAAAQAEKRVSLETLVELGDETCLPALRKHAGRTRAREAWTENRDQRTDPARLAVGREAMALLAACGDLPSRRVILDSIVRGSRVTEPAALLEDAAAGGNLNGFPWGFWTGKSLLMDDPPRPTQWPALSAALDLLRGRPGLLDGLLRDAAAHRKVPDGGKALLLGCLDTATGSDLSTLESLWRNAVGPKAVIAVLSVPTGRGGAFVRVPCNLNASTVVYALARLKAEDSLERLWKSCPNGDLTLKGDLAMAIARVGSRRLAPAVADYVSREWDRVARSRGFENRLGARSVQPSELLLEPSNPFEYSYRSHELTRYLVSLEDRRLLERLTLDPALHPYVRLYWIQRLAGSGKGAWMLSLAEKALSRIEADAQPAEPLLSALTASTRQTVNWFRNRSIGEASSLQ